MTIIFEIIGGTPGVLSGSAGGRVGQSMMAREVPFPPNSGYVNLFMRPQLLQTSNDGSDVPPPSGSYCRGYIRQSVSAHNHTRVSGTASGSVRQRVRSFWTPNFCRIDMRPELLEARWERPGGFTLVGGIGSAQMIASAPTVTLQEAFSIGAALSSLVIKVVSESLALHASQHSKSTATVHVLESLAFDERYSNIYHMLITESLALGATTTLVGQAIARVIDALVLGGAVTSQSDAIVAVVVSIALRAVADQMGRADATEQLALGGTIQNVLTTVKPIIERLLLGAAQTNTLTLMTVVTEQLALSGALSSASDAIVAIRESLGLGLRLSLDTGEYVAYVINAESKGLTQYAQYPFNSFARIGDSGPYMGMTDAGIYTLEGDTDDGDPIQARFRLAMTNMGTARAKRMASAYLGYTATGEIRIKVFVAEKIDDVWVKVAHTYRMREQNADTPVMARVQVGQGLKSTYWGFEIEAIDGAAFAIDLIELVPIVLDQIMGGQNGGEF